MSDARPLPLPPVAHEGDGGAADTRERLLDAAEELFARRGYAATSVRDITAAADSNLAAVNYHFGGKHKLYRAVLLRRLRAIREQRLAALEGTVRDGTDAGDLATPLRAFAEAFLAPVCDAPAEGPPMRLLLREVVDPQLPRDLFETELVMPVQQRLTSAIAVAAPGLDEHTVQLCTQSFIGQLMHVLHAQRLAPADHERGGEALGLAELVDHVVRFTVAALVRLQEDRS